MGHGTGGEDGDDLTPAAEGTAPTGGVTPAGPELPAARHWRGLLYTGGIAAFASVALTAVQVILFTIWPPVYTAGAVFDLMVRTPVLGLISLDALLLVNNILVLLLYFGLAPVLWTVSRSGVALVVGLGLVQMAAYVASNPAVEMLNLSLR